ncbi:MAG: response regulator [Chloroflexi bacterium]|nr:response regulator [Chloroflexota bacterium]
MDNLQGYLLVVEDIPDILNLLDTTLKFKGYRVVTARDGQEALDIIQKEHPALIITDILMPKVDGFNLVHQLRINTETRKIPVIFLSATYVAPEDKSFAVDIGVTHFIEKPVNLEEFLPLVANLLEQGVPAIQEPLTDPDFYNGYRRRLEAKLNQKMKQITRDQGLLDTLSEEEKPAFLTSLQQAISQRDEIQHLLDRINETMERRRKAG